MRDSARVLPLRLLLALLSGCSGTWVDDPVNFKRVFGFSQPSDVKVLHSYYWRSPHWTVEYNYFIALEPSRKFAAGLTSGQLMVAVAPDEKLLDWCSGNCPHWFLPKPLTSYEAWLPKEGPGFRVFRDKNDGTLFLCDQRL